MKNKFVLGIFFFLILMTSSVFASMVENSRQGSPAISAISHPETSTLEQRSHLGFELRFLNFCIRSGIIYTDPFGLEIQIAIDMLAKNPIWQLKYGWQLKQAYEAGNWAEVESIGKEIQLAGQNAFGEWCGLDRVAANILLDPELFAAGVSFSSFHALKMGLGDPGSNNVWHHIVEQFRENRFGANAVHSKKNVVAVSGEINQKIANYYSGIHAVSFPKTVRRWLDDKTFTFQFEFGQMILNRVLSGQGLP